MQQNVTDISSKQDAKALKIKYNDLSQQTMMTIQDLYRNKRLPLSAAMTTKKLFSQLQKAQNKITTEYINEIVGKYSDKDAPKGTPPDALYGFVVKTTTKEAEEALKKEHEDFGNRSIVFEGFSKYKLSALEQANLSAQDLEALEMFIDEKA